MTTTTQSNAPARPSSMGLPVMVLIWLAFLMLPGFITGTFRTAMWLASGAIALAAIAKYVHANGLANIVDRACLAGHLWACRHRYERHKKDLEIAARWDREGVEI